MPNLLSLYLPTYPKALVYMLQSTEYQPGAYLKWYWRTKNFTQVAIRRQLDTTRVAKLLLLALYAGIGLQILLAWLLMLTGLAQDNPGLTALGAGIFLLYPVFWAHLIVLPLLFGRWLVINPKERRLVRNSSDIFKQHPGVKIAVAGSYGKTSMKELLATVLAEGKRVAATPANKNVAISHAAFAKKLSGQEEVLITEYGEGRPGDVARFTATTHPDIGVVTGLAPAHLDHYPSVQAAGEDIMSLAAALPADKVYINAESEALTPFIKKDYRQYSQNGLGGWRVSNVKVDYQGTSFKLTNGKTSYQLKSGLLGRHQIGPLVAAVVIGHQLGLSKTQLEAGVAQTAPYEHRMQPRQLHDAWVIDDAYNGNIEGIKAGTALLKELKAKRKVYVTPGLVDQGSENEAVHKTMGRLIAGAQPDIVVLMHNSVTTWILEGLEAAGFKGTIQIEHEPLRFYNNLDQFVAAGDLVMLQNDWTDNYN